MPVILELQLRASWPLQPTTRQLHGLACAVFENSDTDNHAGQEKAFSVWPLSRSDSDAVGTLDGWLLRTAWLRPALPHSVPAAYGNLRLGHVTCTVTGITHQLASHAQIAAGPPLRRAELAFYSPTYFSQNGTDVVTPDPRLIAGSWRRRWNASLPPGHDLQIDDEAWRHTHRALRLAAFDLRTEPMDTGRGRDRAGFTGTATIEIAADAPDSVRQRFGTLARFASFSGTGAQTTHGFGATSLLAA
jgi:CRISPR-associated endoribonuclease Cas6